mmetsp:Transcript_73431/g.238818  ORF Transcript_73431/g.238818 Transcript_73431/m.238818 type:complete len:215 (-) Transcript_73431:502-1146(-)
MGLFRSAAPTRRSRSGRARGYRPKRTARSIRSRQSWPQMSFASRSSATTPARRPATGAEGLPRISRICWMCSTRSTRCSRSLGRSSHRSLPMLQLQERLPDRPPSNLWSVSRRAVPACRRATCRSTTISCLWPSRRPSRCLGQPAQDARKASRKAKILGPCRRASPRSLSRRRTSRWFLAGQAGWPMADCLTSSTGLLQAVPQSRTSLTWTRLQ